MDTVYLNGKFIPKQDATISVFDRGFLFGDGVYEVLPVYQGMVLCLEEHLLRLNKSLAAIKMAELMPLSAWRKLLAELIEKNGGGDQLLYLHITRGNDGQRSHRINPNTTPTVLLMSAPLQLQPFEQLCLGVAAITSEDIRWGRCDIKSTALLANVLLREQAATQGADETILMRDGYALEGSSSNIFVVKAGVITTPPKNHNILSGVTRDLVIELAQQHHFPVTEEPISEALLRSADEIWITSSSREVWPVVSLDGKPVGDGHAGHVWRSLVQHYQAYKQALIDAG